MSKNKPIITSVICCLLVALFATTALLSAGCTPTTPERAKHEITHWDVTPKPTSKAVSAPTQKPASVPTSKPTATPTPKPTATPTPKPTEPPLFVFKGSTDKSTPIVDPTKSAFKLSWCDMYDTPDSTCFTEIGCYADMEILVVTFRASGATYVYLDIPPSVWEGLYNARSIGGYYNSDIKGQYTCYRWG